MQSNLRNFIPKNSYHFLKLSDELDEYNQYLFSRILEELFGDKNIGVVGFDDLSKEDQQKRTTEFNRRMKIATKFMSGLRDGKIDEEFVDLVEDDDPMKETIEILKIKVDIMVLAIIVILRPSGGRKYRYGT